MPIYRNATRDRGIGARIRTARREAHLSQSVLAERLNVTWQQVQKYENGTNRVPASMLAELGHALNRPAAWFIDEEFSVLATEKGPELLDVVASATALQALPDPRVRDLLHKLIVTLGTGRA